MQIVVKEKAGQQQIEALLASLEILSKDQLGKADKKNCQSQLDYLTESLASLSKEMLLKASVKDIMAMIEKKANQEEIYLDINYLKNALQKVNKEMKSLRED
mmetsp:Transcript_1513/g.1489  ORF Transcript_1513/g.1489 Transcript_1513/m.1489 type:complete len:102 (+) Transcript_1513:947-1252(+)